MTSLPANHPMHKLSTTLTPSALAVWRYLSALTRDPAYPRAGLRPRITTIARVVGRCRRTIFRALDQLEQAGVLRRYHRHAPEGDQISSLYVLDQVYRAAVRENVDNLPPFVDNQRGIVDNQGNTVHKSPSRLWKTPAEAPLDAADVTPIDDSTLVRESPSERTASSCGDELLSLWDDRLNDAYTRLIYEPARPNPASLAIILSTGNELVNFWATSVPAGVYWRDAVQHLADRLAALARRDETVVEHPERWIRGYLRRLNRQGSLWRRRRCSTT